MPEFPYYPTYPKDLNSDHKVLVMDNRTYGAYRRLLDIAWHEEPAASLPTDDTILAAYAHESLAGWREIAPLVLNCFQKRGNRWYQKRLRSEWEKLNQIKQRQSAAGKDRWSLAVSLPPSSPYARASDSGSDSGSSPSPVPGGCKGGEEVVREFYELTSCSVPKDPAPETMDEDVWRNCIRLARDGRGLEDFKILCDWSKISQSDFRPNSRRQLSNPKLFGQWGTMIEKEKHGNGQHGNRGTQSNRPASALAAAPGKYAGVEHVVEGIKRPAV